MIELIDVYQPLFDNKMRILYELLQEREPYQSISHKEMPIFEQHQQFVYGVPYQYWYLASYKDVVIGSIYLTRRREIGVHIYKQFQGQGYGEKTVKALMDKYPGKFLWNANPKNEASIKLVEKLGGKILQWTYEL